MGTRLAKHGRSIYDNYRSIVEEMAHADIDRLAEARLSVNSANGIQQQKQQSCPHHKPAPPPPSAASSTTGSSVTATPSSVASMATPSTTRVLVHSSQNGGVSVRSTTEDARAESIERGFNCDSPEGGTIKKKPQQQQSQQLNGLSSFRPKSKGVRFRDTYSLIGDDEDIAEDDDVDGNNNGDPFDAPPAHRQQTYATMRRGTPPRHQYTIDPLLLPGALEQKEYSVMSNIDDVLAGNKLALRGASPPEDVPGQGLAHRRYSTESLVSNPQLMHTATLVTRASPPLTLSSDMTQSWCAPIPVAATSAPSPPQQPQRPAPVLAVKPQVSRKPSLDKDELLRRQQAAQQQPQPSFEDTLRKCRSLTEGRQRSASETETEKSLQQQKQQQQQTGAVNGNSKPPSPALPPKPSPARLRELAAEKKIAHLPPSGRSASVGRQQQQQQHPIAFKPFPNRLSSGEYENAPSASTNGSSSNKASPPVPKRNDETHLSRQ